MGFYGALWGAVGLCGALCGPVAQKCTFLIYRTVVEHDVSGVKLSGALWGSVGLCELLWGPEAQKCTFLIYRIVVEHDVSGVGPCGALKGSVGLCDALGQHCGAPSMLRDVPGTLCHVPTMSRNVLYRPQKLHSRSDHEYCG